MSVAAVASTPVATAAVSTTTPVAQTAAASSSSTSTSAASGGDGTGPVATQVMQWASIVADGSGASTAEKAAAYVAINAAFTQGLTSGTNQYFAQATLAQRKSVANIMDNSSFAKQSYAAAQSFAAQQNDLDHAADTAGGDVSPANSQLARLNQLSADQQQLVFAGLDTGCTTLEAWKAQLQTAQGTQAASSASVTVSLSDSAKTALAGSSQTVSPTTSSQTATDPNAKALQTLTSKAAGTTSADVGLAVLQSAAQAKAAAADSDSNQGAGASATSAKTSTADSSDKPYQTGDRLSLTA